MSPGTERQKRFRSEHTVTTKCREHVRDLMRPAGKGPLRAVCAASMPLAEKHCFLTVTLQRERKKIIP